MIMIPLSFSDPDRKLVVIESFSEVVYLERIPERLTFHGSNVSSSSELELEVVDPERCFYNKQQ